MVRLGAFGDVVRTLPSAWALRRRFPGAHLAWLVEPGSAALLERLPWLDEVIVFPRADFERALTPGRVGALGVLGREVRRGLRRASFDCVVDFHGLLKSAWLARWTGAPRRVGLGGPDAREGAAAFYTDRVRPPSGPQPRWVRNAALAERLGARVDTSPIPGLAPAAPGRPRGSHALLHPGSSPGTPYKRYPVARFAEVARALAAELGAPCLVTCSADAQERGDAERLVALSGGAARLLDMGADVGALIEALAEARVCVAGDTGPLHLASLVGTPVVQILGPTHPIQNEPWPGTPWARAHLPLPCSPCRRGCDAAPCMRLLPTTDVVAAVRRVLQSSASVDGEHPAESRAALSTPVPLAVPTALGGVRG